MSGDFEIGVQAETGNSQVVYNNNYQAQNEFYLTEAALNFQVTDAVLLRGGAFAQGKFENPLLFGPTISFPGVQQAVNLYRDSGGNFPTSGARSHTEFSNDDTGSDTKPGMPSFLTAGPVLKFGQRATDSVSGSVHARYFSLQQSSGERRAGQSFPRKHVSGIGGQGAEFLYGFQGAETAANFKLNLSRDFKPFVQAAANRELRRTFGVESGCSDEVWVPTSRFQLKSILTPASGVFLHPVRCGSSLLQ